MKNFVHFLFFSILLTELSFAYSSLYIQDPQNPWRGGQGTVEEAVLSLKPSGIYTEYELYLTFSAKGLGFLNSDTLEIQFNFDLPENSIVCDSWLWIEDTVVQAIIMDQWTASAIYEDIVDRRRDPSILFKRDATHYELRIFPMAGDSSRKVKITYLVPAQWNSVNILSPLPTNLLKTSLYPVESLQLLVWLNAALQNPKIFEFPDIDFQNVADTVLGNHLQAYIPSEALQNNLNFSFDVASNNGIFVSKFENETEGLYQMAFLPSRVLNISASSKAAILIDYESINTTVTKNELLNNLKTTLLLQLSSQDSFNIILSKANIQRISENWIQADSIIIDSIFQTLNADLLADYSNLPSLLADGIDFVKNHGNDGTILLISSSDQVGDYQAANQLIDDLIELMDPKLPIHVADFQNQNFSYHWIGGQEYLGNEYFYINITRLTSANYFSIRTNSFSGILTEAAQSLSGSINSFDIHTKLFEGFCYARYNLDPNINSIYFNKPILQIGKFAGNFPFIIEVSGVYKFNPFSQTFILEESEIFTGDSLTEEMWAGNYIKFLENQPQSNERINEIVNYSIDERVLSIYSAFICLEPNMEWEICYECYDNDDIIIGDIEDSLENSSNILLLNAYPNPFNSQINLNVKLPGSVKAENLTFKIYDILGQLVKTFEPDLSAVRNEYHFIWDGSSDNGVYVSSGNYFFIVTTPQKVFSMKLLLMK